MSRDDKGNIGWSIMAFILGIVVIVPMIARELYQSVKGGFNLEWNDIIRYGLLIGIFSVFHWCWVENLTAWPWWACL